jgi:hypothetical protein
MACLMRCGGCFGWKSKFTAAPDSAGGSATMPVGVVLRDATPRRSRGLKCDGGIHATKKAAGMNPAARFVLFERRRFTRKTSTLV